MATQEISVQTETQLALRHEPSTLEVIQALAVDDRVSVEKLAGLMGLHERAQDRSAKQEFTAAFARLQLALPRIKKNGAIDLGRGKPIMFAKWEDMDRVIRPILAAHGFSLSFPTRVEGAALVMMCTLSHIGGHSEQAEAVVAPDTGPGRNNSQAIGSGRAYTKRYLAMDMLNIITEGADDDGNGTDPLTNQQLSNVTDLVNACELTPQRLAAFLKFANAPSVEKIKARDYDRVMAELRRAKK